MTKIRSEFQFKCLCPNGSRNKLIWNYSIIVWCTDRTSIWSASSTLPELAIGPQIHQPLQSLLVSAIHLGIWVKQLKDTLGKTLSFLGLVRKGCKNHSMECPVYMHWPNLLLQCPFTKDTCRDGPVFCHAPERSVALASFICKQVLGGKVTLQTLNTQCLGWQHSLETNQIYNVFFLIELEHDCCPAHTTSKLNYSSILKCQTLCIKVPCFEEPMGVEKVSLEMSLNCIFNLVALCGKYFWLY